MKGLSAMISAGVICIGFGILVASFLPPVLIVSIEALLLIAAGYIALNC